LTAVIDIRRATLLDAEVVGAIDRASFSEPTVNMETEFGHSWSYLFLGRPEGEALPRGFLLAWLVSDELHILSVAAQPDFRRRGLGRALLTHAIDFAKARGARTAVLEVRKSNTAAIELYTVFGFVTARVRPRYYADNDEDAIEMVLEFAP
jgi:ribosomal-protein-alanine N-acetyltransferase